MATVAQVVKSSLQAILVQASEAQIEASEASDFIFSMNNFMAQLAANGINLGYTEVANLSDTITIPTGALRGLIANMAIEVAPSYGATVTEGVGIAAVAGLKTMRLLGQSLGATKLPSTLPVGSGNYNGNYGTVGGFYPESEADILAETVGAIALEI
tara:strand:- start:1342 stop:1812 length:471 start_codon:yes stop_codon:yes gene_type:complete